MSDFTPDEIMVLKAFAAKELAERDWRAHSAALARKACEEGNHAWVRNDPRAIRPYCDRCGKEKK